MKNAFEKTLFKSSETIISIKSDGSVLTDGFNPAVNEMQNLSINDYVLYSLDKDNENLFVPINAAAGIETCFIISENGDVVQFGQNSDVGTYGAINVEDWTDITEIVAAFHAVGLRTDGTVIASGYNSCGQCNVSQWRDIKSIVCGLFITAGIKNDGSVLVSGRPYEWFGDVSNWKNITTISCENNYLLGVDIDGNVYYFGEKIDNSDVITDWKNVEKIIGCDKNFAALTSDGTVLAVGYDELEKNVKDWKDIIDISFASYLLVALDKNGNVFVAGNQTANNYSDFDNKVWKNWKDILKIVTFNSGFLGLAKNGSVKSCLPDTYIYRSEQLPYAKHWHCFTSYENINADYEYGLLEFKNKLAVAKQDFENKKSNSNGKKGSKAFICLLIIICIAIIFGIVHFTKTPKEQTPSDSISTVNTTNTENIPEEANIKPCIKITCDYYELTVPDYWENNYIIYISKDSDTFHILNVYEKSSYQNKGQDDRSYLFGIRMVAKDIKHSYDLDKVIGEIDVSGTQYYLYISRYAYSINGTVDFSNIYCKMYQDVPGVINTISSNSYKITKYPKDNINNIKDIQDMKILDIANSVYYGDVWIYYLLADDFKLNSNNCVSGRDLWNDPNVEDFLSFPSAYGINNVQSLKAYLSNYYTDNYLSSQFFAGNDEWHQGSWYEYKNQLYFEYCWRAAYLGAVSKDDYKIEYISDTSLILHVSPVGQDIDPGDELGDLSMHFYFVLDDGRLKLDNLLQ